MVEIGIKQSNKMKCKQFTHFLGLRKQIFQTQKNIRCTALLMTITRAFILDHAKLIVL
jgi:hypothetical protein